MANDYLVTMRKMLGSTNSSRSNFKHVVKLILTMMTLQRFRLEYNENLTLKVNESFAVLQQFIRLPKSRLDLNTENDALSYVCNIKGY